MEDREKNITLAKLAEQAERYEDMAGYMKSVAQLEDAELSTEERNLLSVAYKNVAGARRSAWRIVQSLFDKKDSQGSPTDLLGHYREAIEEELRNTCNEVIELIDKLLVGATSRASAGGSHAEEAVFFLKMKGDYYRYLTEIETGDKRKETAENTHESYKRAEEIAEKELKPTHPIYLGLSLNFSVFHYEIRNDGRKACELAKKAFDNAIAELDSLAEDSYKDSTLIMQLLRDNLTLWTSENDNEDNEDQ